MNAEDHSRCRPAQTTLNGEKALCYARARVQTNDFDRSKRQQVILKALKDKMTSLGTLADFNKVNNILNIIGDNVKTDMTPDEMKGFYEQYSNMKDADIVQRVFENSEKGLLEVPSANSNLGYILVPIAGQDNYSQLQDASLNVFTQEAQKGYIYCQLLRSMLRNTSSLILLPPIGTRYNLPKKKKSKARIESCFSFHFFFQTIDT